MDVRKVYEYALQREKEGYRFFKSSAENSSHAAVKGVFKKLANEELKHIEYVQGLIEGSSDKTAQTAGILNEDDWFRSKAKEELLEQSIIESMIPDVAVLRTAYLIERDLAEFYTNAAERSSGEAKEALTLLAKWEKGHEAFFKEMHDRIFQEYTQMPWGG